MTGNEVGFVVCVVVGERMGSRVWSMDFLAAVLSGIGGGCAVRVERLRV